MPLGGTWSSDSQDPGLQYGSTLTVEELTAPRGADGLRPRRLTLVGSALPFQGARWGGENALTTTWYPGNGEEATQQILGPREAPSSWEGVWRRTLLGRAPVPYWDERGLYNTLVQPDVLRDVFESILRGGARLRVTWTVAGAVADGDPRYSTLRNVQKQIVREGRAKSWAFPHDRHTDIEWSVEFHWVSRGRSVASVASGRDETDPLQLAAALESNLNATRAELDTRQRTLPGASDKAVPRVTLGQFEQLAKAPSTLARVYARKLTQLTSSFKQAGQIVNTFARQPFEVANVAVDTAHNAVSVANEFVDQMGRLPLEAQATKARAAALVRAAQGFGRQTETAVLAARRWRDAQAKLERAAVRFASRGPGGQPHAQASKGHVRAQVLAVHVVRDGETPTRLSMRYYGTPDRAADILRANRLPLSLARLPRGRVLFIPSSAAPARAS